MMLNLLRHAMHSPHNLLPLPAQAHCPHPPEKYMSQHCKCTKSLFQKSVMPKLGIITIFKKSNSVNLTRKTITDSGFDVD